MGGSVRVRAQSPLRLPFTFHAARMYPDCCELLLQFDADPNAKRRCGAAAAAPQNSFQLSTSPSSPPPTPNLPLLPSSSPLPSSCDGLTPLIFACSRTLPSLPRDADVVALCVDVKQRSAQPANKSWAACVRSLLQPRARYAGANVQLRDDLKRTCLYV